MSDSLFFYIAATEYLRKTYSIEPEDINLDEAKCQQALDNNETPQEMIDGIAEKYNLTKVSDWTIDKAINFMSRFDKDIRKKFKKQ